MTGPVHARPAWPGEARACRMLLPAAFLGTTPELFVARGPDGALLGAAALRWEGRADPPGFPLLVEVVPAARRGGAGRALVAAAATAAQGEAPGLWAWDLLPDGGPAARFLLACGFLPRTRVRHYRAEVAPLAALADALVARLRRRGRVPAGARLAPMRQADMAAVAQLISVEMGTPADGLHARLLAGEYAPDGSLVVSVDGRLAGCVLVRLDAEPVTDAIVVAPGYRSGWANAMLLAGITAAGLAAGQTHFRFIAEDGVRDTVNLAVRAGATVEEERVGLYCALA